eukprot:GHVU01222738.1.p1 GENE.GHVU01222738.1~~GHVU01222738.1.p1  ORF type:complete len:129 (-),score=6.62 GHVU01222738.1:37-423(-)
MSPKRASVPPPVTVWSEGSEGNYVGNDVPFGVHGAHRAVKVCREVLDAVLLKRLCYKATPTAHYIPYWNTLQHFALVLGPVLFSNLKMVSRVLLLRRCAQSRAGLDFLAISSPCKGQGTGGEAGIHDS